MSRHFTTVPPATAARTILEAIFGAREEFADRHTTADALAPFQCAAVTRAETIIATYGGVLIADPVGMGKTRVGAALAIAAAHAGKHTLLVIPATLRRQWTAALRLTRPARQPAITITTHTALSRDEAPDDERPFQRVIIDEAHAFRNPDTRRYRALARLTRTAEVVLLTATPINNSLTDLYFLIRLFAGDNTFAPLGAPDLRQLFHLASLAPDAPPAPALDTVLRAITIRRTRAEVGAEHLPPTTRFPERAAPHTVRYGPTPEFQDWFDRAIRTIDALRLAPYSLDDYGLAGEPAGAAPLLHLLLAKRLESGMAAFCRSANDLCTRMGEFLEGIDRGFLRPPSRTRDNDGAQLLIDELLFQPLPRHLDRDRLAADTRNDLGLLTSLVRTAAGIEDPKARALENLLFTDLARQQVLVFTEFRDTATDLWRRFVHHGGIALIHGSAAWLGTGQAGRTEVIRRFAPAANDVSTPPPHEAVRILLATDVLSEGLNLQDAAHVVSYDLPWNPVRLLQRIGRIDRLGSPHQTIHSHHFLPDAGLENLLGLVQRLRRKLAAIRMGLVHAATDQTPTAGPRGAETAPDDTDTLTIVERLANSDPSLLDDIERLDSSSAVNDSTLRRIWLQLPPRHPPADAPPRPERTEPLAPTGTPPRDPYVPVARLALSRTEPPAALTPVALVALEVHGQTRVFETYLDHTAREATAAAASLLEKALRPDLDSVSPTNEETTTKPGRTEPRKDRLHLERQITAAMRAATTPAPPLVPNTTAATRQLASRRPHTAQATQPATPARPLTPSPAHRVLRHLRSTAASTPGGPTPELCSRIDTITATLSQPLRAGHDLALENLLAAARWTAPATPEALCTQIETVLQSTPRPHPTPVSRSSPTSPLAIILINPQ